MKGTYSTDDSPSDIAEIRLDKAVPLKVHRNNTCLVIIRYSVYHSDTVWGREPKAMHRPTLVTDLDAYSLSDECILLQEGVKYAVRLRNYGSRTANGDGGMTTVQCSDGVSFTFSTCSLSSNGTNQTRGQIPQILYYR